MGDLTEEYLTEIQKRCDAASPGPWLTPVEAGDAYKVRVVDHEGCSVWPWDRAEDMELAYKARTDLPLCLGEIGRLRALINTPETDDFMKAVPLEAAHQVERWGTEHDAGKTPADWFWLTGYLAGKALHAICSGNVDKAKHHIITTAAALLNWHKAISGIDTRMRPGIDGPKEEWVTEEEAKTQPITPVEFEERMRKIADEEDTYYAHVKMDELMCKLLRSLGYEAGVKIFEDTDKWWG